MKEENSCEKDSFKVLVNPVLKNKNEQHGTPARESQAEPGLSESTRNNGQAGPPDDVDGLVQDVLVPISKMVFLKIIFIDIGITAGDVATDLIQGLSLTFDGAWNLQSTWVYGLVICLVMWLPAPIAILVYSDVIKSSSKWPLTIFKWILFILFFPLVPIVMFLQILFTNRRFSSGDELVSFELLEKRARELKSITGAIESPVQAVIIFWLMLRGVLTLPWSQPPTSACVEDSLGRVACLPSIPIFSLIFSFLSIIKSLFDLNIHPLLQGFHNNAKNFKFSLHFFLCSFPFYLCSTVFR
ncbi:uncharacterized protein LOC111712514 isoform X2 [Eurytemora carolleeae]|nr:uncharacterized protein LOC111712514 isoform X2 [Eurytemora carolleeae]|eukprot:XP_023342920.1 uncharacterized protein LOC111712514 isoform X2 [Eurytemora affinis]